MADRPRIAWFSRLDSEESPSAYFSALTLPVLERHFEIELFDSAERTFLGRGTRHFLKAWALHAEKPFDLFFYQLENAKEAHFVRFHLGLEPGVVLFHDLFLSDEGPEPLLDSHWRAFIEKYAGEREEWPARGSKPPPPALPGTREASLALAAIFTSERNQEEYRRMTGRTIAAPGRTYHLPWPVAATGYVEPPGKLRTIGFAGGPRIEHRAHKLLQALSECRSAPELIWLVSEEERPAASELLKEFRIESCELVAGRSPERWREIVSRCDAAVHTLFSMHGHPWPYLSISMMAGRPCIVTKFGHTESISDRAVFKIEPGESEARQIREVLDSLRDVGCAEIGRPGMEMIREEAPVELVGDGLACIFRESALRIGSARGRWKELQRDAARAIVKESAIAAASGFEGAEIFAGSEGLWNTLYRGAYEELWPRLFD